MEMAVGPTLGKAQEIIRGEFKLPHEVRWEDSVLPMGEYVYFVDSNHWPALVRVEQKGGSFSGVFVARGMLKPGKHVDAGLSMEDAGTGSHVVSLYLRGKVGELYFSGPDPEAGNPAGGEVRTEDSATWSVRKLGYLTILNPNHEKVAVDTVEKVYLRVCEAVEKEFSRTTPVRPRMVVRLGADDNILRYPMGEIQLKKWDEYRFADAVLDLAMHDLLPPQERLRLSNSAVQEAGTTVTVCELKACRN
jgi:hypothetical protein